MPMVRFRLDLGPLEDGPTKQLPGFNEGLLERLPGLNRHGCSYGAPGGFVRRLTEGTWLGHVVEHIALELQVLAGAPVTRGKTRSVKGAPGVYDVLYNYRDEEVGLLAGRLALELVRTLLPATLREVQGLDMLHAQAWPDPFELSEALAALKVLVRRHSLGPTTASLVREAERRGIPALRLDEQSLVQLGWGARQQRLRSSITGR